MEETAMTSLEKDSGNAYGDMLREYTAEQIEDMIMRWNVSPETAEHLRRYWLEANEAVSV